MDVNLDETAKTVRVDETILYPNHSAETLNDLVLAVVPNLWPDGFTLSALSVDDAPITVYGLNGQQLNFVLPQPLQPGGAARLSIQYTLKLPYAPQTDPNDERPRIYGYTDRQINLTNWYPFIVPRDPQNGWLLHDPWFYGEHLVYEAADYTVNLKADPALVVASSGAAEPNGEWTRYTLQAGRAFIFSMSRDYQVESQQVGDVTVYSYFFAPYERSGKLSLTASAQAVELFSQKFGPYPHKTLSVIMGEFDDGMEYSASYFTSKSYYDRYQGEPSNPIMSMHVVYLAAHETSHQWWFEKVANDQALEPWLDESLAAYSERIFYEHYQPDQLSTWWYVRSDVYNPQGMVDIPVYEGGGYRPYTNATYFVGAHFLEDLRARIGDEAFFAFLGDYAAQMSGKIATAADFFRILRQHTGQDISDILVAYFRSPH